MLRKILFTVLSCFLLGSCTAEATDTLTLIALNVGKADALLLQSGEMTYLIDTGTPESWGMVSSALRQMGITRLEGVIITHTDHDHAGGAFPLAMSGIEVGGWYAPACYTGVKDSKHPLRVAAALRNEEVTFLQAGDTLPLPHAALKVIGPLSLNEKKENCNSLVLLVQGGGGQMLLTGDMEFPEEEELLSAGVIPACQVLKVGNHGESDATSPELIYQVQPQVAVISTNTVAEPDTPADRVMELLAGCGAEIYQTQNAAVGIRVVLQNGQVQVSNLSNGQLPQRNQTLRLTDRRAKADTICLVNDGQEAVDLDGWYILSERGKEIFVFRDTTIQPGQKLTISSLSSDEAGDLIWPDKKVWHKSKADKAYLYDAYGRLIDELD